MKHNDNGEIILDTHAWIWLAEGDDALGRSPALKSLQAAAEEGRLRLSAISIWELGMLESKGRLTLAMNCMDWVNRAIVATGLVIVPLSPEIAIESSRLPHAFHGDPADRIIVATARNLGAVVATRDKAILEYGKQGNVNVMVV